MSDTVIKIEDVSKQYRLGVVGTGTIANDLKRWWASVRGKEDPFLRLGEENDRTVASDSKFVWALKGVNLEVQKGEVLGIIGRNGAGKSTLLKLLSRVTAPTTGEIKIKGKIASLLEVGTGFHPELTGRENIYLNGSILGMSRKEIDSKYDEIVEFSGVERYINTPVKRYSSGMYVRLAFAVAAHLEPDILVVDEVLAVGDVEFQKRCIGKMQEVSSKGRTVLFVSHNLNSVKTLCTRAVLVDKGKIAVEGEVSEVIDAYLNAGADLSKGDIPEDAPRNWGRNNAWFRRVELVDDQGAQIDNVYYKESLKVRYHIEVQEPIEDAMLQLRVGKPDGTMITYTSSMDEDKQLLDLPVGNHTVEIDVNPNLLPGLYSFYPVLCSADCTHPYDSVQNVYKFRVLPTLRNGENHFPFEQTVLHVKVDGQWKYSEGIKIKAAKTINS